MLVLGGRSPSALSVQCCRVSTVTRYRFAAFLGKLFRMWPRSPSRGFWNGCGRQPYYCFKVSIVIKLVIPNFRASLLRSLLFSRGCISSLLLLRRHYSASGHKKSGGPGLSPIPRMAVYRCRFSCRKVATVCSIATMRRSWWSRSSNVLSIHRTTSRCRARSCSARGRSVRRCARCACYSASDMGEAVGSSQEARRRPCARTQGIPPCAKVHQRRRLLR